MKLKNTGITIITLIILAIVLYAGFIVWNVWPISMENLDKAGAFGDSFGVLTSLFSGLAFAGIIITILLQREELALQRKELKLTRGELSTQNTTSKLQAFENTFFQMLRVHNELLESIDLSQTVRNTFEKITTGRDCFIIFSHYLERQYFNASRLRSARSIDEMELIDISYEEFWNNNGKELAHYFRYLYSLFKFVETRAPDEKFYAKIIRAQLSNQEMFILFYNCLSVHGKDNFKPLIEKYAVFNNLPKDSLLEESHVDFYTASAYDWNETNESG